MARKPTNALNQKGVHFSDSPSIDAFSRLRVSNPTTVFDNQFTYGLQPVVFEQITTDNATILHDATNRCAIYTFASALDTNSAYMQSYEHVRYQPSKSQLVFITFNFNGSDDEVIQTVGLSDGSDGFELRNNKGDLEFVLRSSSGADDIVVPQSEWNLNTFDGKDGTTALDLEKTHILVIDFQALYVGRVCFGFDINGTITYAHEINNANVQEHPYIATANLPIRVGMAATGEVEAKTMDFICCAVVSEGGREFSMGYEFSAENGVTAGNDTDTHVLSVQPRATFNDIANRTKFILDSVSIVVTGANPIEWKLAIGQGLLSTPTVADVNPTYSATSKVTGDLSGDPAIILLSGYVGATNQFTGSISSNVESKYPITLDAAGDVRTMGRISVIAKGLGGASAMRAILNWREIQ